MGSIEFAPVNGDAPASLKAAPFEGQAQQQQQQAPEHIELPPASFLPLAQPQPHRVDSSSSLAAQPPTPAGAPVPPPTLPAAFTPEPSFPPAAAPFAPTTAEDEQAAHQAFIDQVLPLAPLPVEPSTALPAATEAVLSPQSQKRALDSEEPVTQAKADEAALSGEDSERELKRPRLESNDVAQEQAFADLAAQADISQPLTFAPSLSEPPEHGGDFVHSTAPSAGTSVFESATEGSVHGGDSFVAPSFPVAALEPQEEDNTMMDTSMDASGIADASGIVEDEPEEFKATLLPEVAVPAPNGILSQSQTPALAEADGTLPLPAPAAAAATATEGAVDMFPLPGAPVESGPPAVPMPPSAVDGGLVDDSAPASSTGSPALLPPLPATTAAASGAEASTSSAGPPVAPAVAAFTRNQHKSALNVLRTVKKHRCAPPFLRPVDPVLLNIPDYFNVVTHPMDIGTIEAKVAATGKAITAAQKVGRVFGVDYSGVGNWEGKVGVAGSSTSSSESVGVYRTSEALKQDFDRVFENCYRYNGAREKNAVSEMAALLQEAFEKSWKSMPAAPMVDAAPPKVKQPAKTAMKAPKTQQGRMDSFDGGRPKREVHAPSKDLPYLAAERAAGNKALSSREIGEQTRYCKEVVKELFKKQYESFVFPFYAPVDWRALNIPNYLEIVRNPMDFGTIRSKLESGAYNPNVYANFESDVRLLLTNCWAFNPVGTPVYEFGKKVEGLFNAKWTRRPDTASDEEDEDEDEDDEDDGGAGYSNPDIKAMEQQLKMLQDNLEAMKSQGMINKPSKAAKKINKLKEGLSSAKAKKNGGGGGRSSLGGASGSGSKPSKQRRLSGSGVNGAGPSSGGGSSAQKKRPSLSGAGAGGSSGKLYRGGSDDEGYQPTVTFEMKRELAVKITTFDGENLEKAIDIIRRGRPDLLADESKEIELDIDQLDQRTLLNLYKFVCPKKRNKGGNGTPTGTVARRRADGRNKGGRAGTGGPQRKNLDEEKETERIQALEDRLRDFEGAGAGQRENSLGAQLMTVGHDEDQPSSDSSDDGSDSDTDGETD